MKVRNIDEIVMMCRSHIGTPFKHRGRSNHGLDCAGLIVKSLTDLGYEPVDMKVYGREPFKDGLRQTVQANMGTPIDLKDLSFGDVVLIRFHKDPHHVGIIGTHPADKNILTLIHAYGEEGRVVEHSLGKHWRSLIVEAYRFEVDEGVNA